VEDEGIWAIVLITMSVASLVYFVGVVAYYRYKYAKEGTPPFDVPSGCPMFLFPRSNYESTATQQLSVFR
jgi:hypothetical protein